MDEAKIRNDFEKHYLGGKNKQGGAWNDGLCLGGYDQRKYEMNWRTPTTYLQRLGDAMALLCSGNRPSDEMLGAWINECEGDFRLQEFACEHGPSWAQGIAVIDAAQVLADQPTEILCIDGPQIDHERHNDKLRG